MIIGGTIIYGASVGSILGWIVYVVGNSGSSEPNTKISKLNLFFHFLLFGSIGSILALGHVYVYINKK
jgi:uncharacterized membrane protein YsdA (DUF1294 family)